MNDLEQIESLISKRFFSKVEIEDEIIEAVFACIQRKGYLELLKKYGFEQMKEVCLVDYSTGVVEKHVYTALKALPSSNFI